ncbi:MAG: TonB-dependent siderophore receptor [Acidobacteria bacterium]|nr:TonB-dependent siderophore receptor [Acidobacteriota bacterium]
MWNSQEEANVRKPYKSGGWPVVYRWAATGALVAYSALGSKTVVPAMAQSAPPGPRPNDANPSPAARAVKKFNIPAGPLSEALPAFRRISGIEVKATSLNVLEIQSPGVAGELRVEEALRRLLEGTQVRYQFTAPEVAELELFGPVTQVEVRATAAPSSPKYTAPLRDVPQTITVVDQAIIRQQGAMSLADVLSNVTGLTVMAGEGGTPAGDNLTLRGFSASSDIFVDGVRDLGPQSRDPFTMEQVEVVKGPQSAFTGRGSAGGSINLVTKSASLQPRADVSFAAGTANLKRGTADLNTPIPFLGERTAFRLNLMGHDSGTPGRDVVKSSRYGVAPAITFGLGSPTRVILNYSRVEQNNISDYGIPWVPATNNVLVDYRDRPAPVPRETFYGYRDRDKEKMSSNNATFRLEHDFSDKLTLRNQFRYGNSFRDSIATPPRFASADSTDINREMRSWLTNADIYDNQTDVRADFTTGKIKHNVVTGAAFSKEYTDRASRSAPNSLTTLLNPNPDDVYTGAFTYNPIVGEVNANTQAVYLFDTVQLGRRFQVNGGMRGERFDANGIATNGDPVKKTVNMASVRAGLVYKPASAGSFYASYGSSMNPSLVALSYGASANTANLDPEKTYTVEAGTKWDLIGSRLLLTAALFEVQKTNAQTPGVLADDPPTVLQGKQRVRGVELGATGYITRSWMVFSGFTGMTSRIIESNTPSQIGNRFPQSPPQSFNFWTTYTFPKRVMIGGGSRYMGKRFNNVNNTRFVDGYWTADLMASVPFGEKIDLRVNLTNVTDEYYFSRVGGGHVVPGPARQLIGTLNFRF